NEQHEHQPVRDVDDPVDFPAVRGVIRRHPLPQNLLHVISQRRPPSMRWNCSRLRCSSFARRRKLRNIATNPICTNATHDTRNRMAVSIPLEIDVGPPKQTGQAEADVATKATRQPSNPATRFTKDPSTFETPSRHMRPTPRRRLETR